MAPFNSVQRVAAQFRKGKEAAKKNEKIKMEKRIQRVLMAIPCAVYKVFRNAEKRNQ